jgi:hypothetical protein
VPKEILQQSLPTNEHAPSIGGPNAADPDVERPASAQSVHSQARIHDLLNPTSSMEDPITSPFDEEQSGDVLRATTPFSLAPLQAVGTPESCCASEQESAGSQSSGQNGSGRKRLHGEIDGPENQEKKSGLQQDHPQSTVKCSLVRLSMTVDGAVKVKTTLEDTPSPQKERALPPPARNNKGLQRRKSAIEGSSLSTGIVRDESTPLVFDRSFGRSRDARTWEFYCDSNARDALSSHAETERSGSAVGAINLIRSQSHKSKKRPLISQATKGSPRGVLGPLPGKPKLSRAKSSTARLHTFDGDCNLTAAKTDSPGLVRSPSGDSDKENWAPGTRQSVNPLRRTHPNGGRQGGLQDNEMPPAASHSGVGESVQLGPRRSMESSIDHTETVSLDKEKEGVDLDCVQGLLSLSQGAWK